MSVNNNADTPKYIFLDSSLSLEAMKTNYGYGNPTIVTSSPLLLTSQSINCDSFESENHESSILNLIYSGLPFSIEIYKTLNNEGFSSYALLAALQVHNLQKWIRKAIPLDDKYFTDSVAVVQIVDKDNKVISAYDNKMNELLENNPNLTTLPLRFDEIVDDRFNIPIVDKYNALKKRAFAKYNRIFSKIISIADDKNDDYNGVIAIYPSRNHLLVELSSGLNERGYKIEKLVKYETKKSNYDLNKYSNVFDVIEPIVITHLSKFVNSNSIKALLNIYKRQLFHAFDEYNCQISKWQLQIDKLSPKAIMSSFPARPDMIALSEVCAIRKIPYISAQHGFGREVDALHEVSIATYENNVADLVLTYNGVSAKNSDENNPFKKGYCIKAGFPSYVETQINQQSIMHKGNIFKSKYPEIIYISNMLFMGNAQMIHVGTGSDAMKAHHDIDLMNLVFKDINKKVLFKLYPVSAIKLSFNRKNPNRTQYAPNRYLDINPIKAAALKVKNITLYDGNQDALRMLKNHKIIVLTGCSTSLGNSLISKLPLVFINHHKIRPMRTDVFEELANSIFCFDVLDVDFHKNLRDFLNMDIEKIQNLWDRKLECREGFISKYVDSSYFSDFTEDTTETVSEFIKTF